jgi:hypothetical protein
MQKLGAQKIELMLEQAIALLETPLALAGHFVASAAARQ